MARSDNNESGIFSDILEQTLTMNDAVFHQFEEIASGTYSRLMLALRYGQQWVLKCLKDEYREQPFFQELLEKEYAVVSRLSHPNVVKAISIETVEGLGRCIVMQYVEGQTLDTVDADVATRRRLAFQLVEAAGYLHSQQVVHRDLKPQNVIVTNNGQNIVLIDFGFADADSYLVLKQPAGTHPYASPEQYEHHVADARNDIYSLGIMLRELRIGWQYRCVIRRCVGAFGRRYANAGVLLQALTRAARLPRRLLLTMVMLLVLAQTAFLIFMPHKVEVQRQTVRVGMPAESVLVIKTQVDTLIMLSEAEREHADRYRTAFGNATRQVDAYMHQHQYKHYLESTRSCMDQCLKTGVMPEGYMTMIQEWMEVQNGAMKLLAELHEQQKGKLDAKQLAEFELNTQQYLTTSYILPIAQEISRVNEHSQSPSATPAPDAGTSVGTPDANAAGL